MKNIIDITSKEESKPNQELSVLYNIFLKHVEAKYGSLTAHLCKEQIDANLKIGRIVPGLRVLRSVLKLKGW
jgi:predicted membrane GTPase involved in stress response